MGLAACSINLQGFASFVCRQSTPFCGFHKHPVTSWTGPEPSAYTLTISCVTDLSCLILLPYPWPLLHKLCLQPFLSYCHLVSHRPAQPTDTVAIPQPLPPENRRLLTGDRFSGAHQELTSASNSPRGMAFEHGASSVPLKGSGYPYFPPVKSSSEPP